jgi:hypothetical protein
MPPNLCTSVLFVQDRVVRQDAGTDEQIGKTQIARPIACIHRIASYRILCTMLSPVASSTEHELGKPHKAMHTQRRYQCQLR